MKKKVDNQHGRNDDIIDRLAKDIIKKYKDNSLKINKVGLKALYEKYDRNYELTLHRINRNKKHYFDYIFVDSIYKSKKR